MHSSTSVQCSTKRRNTQAVQRTTVPDKQYRNSCTAGTVQHVTPAPYHYLYSNALHSHVVLFRIGQYSAVHQYSKAQHSTARRNSSTAYTTTQHCCRIILQQYVVPYRCTSSTAAQHTHHSNNSTHFIATKASTCNNSRTFSTFVYEGVRQARGTAAVRYGCMTCPLDTYDPERSTATQGSNSRPCRLRKITGALLGIYLQQYQKLTGALYRRTPQV